MVFLSKHNFHRRCKKGHFSCWETVWSRYQSLPYTKNWIRCYACPFDLVFISLQRIWERTQISFATFSECSPRSTAIMYVASRYFINPTTPGQDLQNPGFECAWLQPQPTEPSAILHCVITTHLDYAAEFVTNRAEDHRQGEGRTPIRPF